MNCITNMKEKKMSNLSEDIINKYLTGQCTEEELIEVNAWMKESEENALQLFRMEEIYHLGKFNQYADGQRMARAEKQLYRKLDEEKGKQNKILRMHRWMRYAVAIAAILVIGGGAGYWFYQSGTDQQMMVAVANEGIVKEVVLPDGTKVWLNNSAILKYPREFSEKERNVHLEGEAYFEVQHDDKMPFIVKTSKSAIRVYGTSFNVKAYPDDSFQKTTLEEGSIGLQVNDKEFKLVPNQQAVLNTANEVNVIKIKARQQSAWRHGRFLFDNENLEDIMAQLARWYDVNIFFVGPKVKNLHFSGEIDRYENIEKVLHMIGLTTNISFSINGKTITITPE